MKTIKFSLVSLFLVSGILLNTLNGFSQDIKLTRAEKKEVRKAQMEANFRILDSLLSAKTFILVADYLRNTYGDMIPVVPSSD